MFVFFPFQIVPNEKITRRKIGWLCGPRNIAEVRDDVPRKELPRVTHCSFCCVRSGPILLDRNILDVVVDLGFTLLLTTQVICVAFYSESEKSDIFCSETLISAWGSFICRKPTTRDPRGPRLYFPSEGSRTRDFYALKNPSTPAGIKPASVGSRGEYDNHWTTGVTFEFMTKHSGNYHW